MMLIGLSSLVILLPGSYFWSLQYQPLFFQLMILVISLSCLIYYRKRFKVQYSVLDILTFVSVLYVLVNNRTGNLSVFNPILTYLALFFLIKHVITENKKLYFPVTVFIFLGVLNCFIAILQLGNVYPIVFRPYVITGLFANPAQLAGFITAVLPFSLYNARSKGIIWIPVIILFISIIIISGSRAALFSSTIVIVIAGLHSIRFLQKKSAAKIFTLIALFFILCCFLYVLYQFRTSSADGRFLIWKAGYSMFTDSPLFGQGASSFVKDYALYQAKFFNAGFGTSDEILLARNASYVFNEFLHIAIEEGITGLLLFISIIYRITTIFNKNKDSANLYIGMSTLSTIIFGLFSYPADSSTINFVFIFCLAYYASKDQAHNLPNAIKVYLFAIAATILFILNVTVSFTILEIMKWQRADKSWNIDESNAIELYRDLEPVLCYKPEFMYNYLSQLTSFHYYEDAIKLYTKYGMRFNNSTDLLLQLGYCYEKSAHSLKAEHYYKLASSITPGLLLPKFYLLNLYIASNEHIKAAAIAKQLISMPVKVQNTNTDHIIKTAYDYLYSPDKKPALILNSDTKHR